MQTNCNNDDQTNISLSPILILPIERILVLNICEVDGNKASLSIMIVKSLLACMELGRSI